MLLVFYPSNYCPQVVTSTNRPPINNNTITGSIDGVTVYYNHSELYYTFPVSRTNEMQSLCLVVEVFNDIGSTVVYNSCIGELSGVLIMH